VKPTGSDDRGPRLANLFVLVNLGLLEVASSLLEFMVRRPHTDKSAAPYLIWVAGMAAAPLLQLFISVPRFAAVRARYRRRLLLLDLLIAYLPVLGPLHLQASAGFPMASTLILFTGRVRWLLFSAQLVAVFALDYYFWPVNSLGKSHDYVFYWALDAVDCCLEVYGITRFAQIMTSLHATKREVGLTSLTVERLRAGRDLHDLLGFSMTSIILKLELARRALVRGHGAAEEIEEAARLTERALADVRTVSDGEPLSSLTGEATSARTVLGWSGIDAQVTVEGGALPPAVDAALALVLREAVTNVLRHSSAGRCVVTATVVDGTLRLAVSNDGAGPPAGSGGGSGLRNLATRLAPLGGHLHTRHEADWFQLTATTPLPPSRRRRRTRPVAISWAIAVLALLNLTDYVDPFYWIRVATSVAVASLACTVVALVLTVHLARPRTDGGPPSYRRTAFTALAVLSTVPFLLGWPLATYTTLVGATALAIFRNRTGWTVFCVAAVADPLLTAVISHGGHLDPAAAFIDLVSVVYFQLLFYALFRLARMVNELTEAQAELARVTVTRERLRFGRDLNDRLGSGLLEVARSVARAQAAHSDEVEAELVEALRLARRTSEDTRSIAHGEQRGVDRETLAPQT
jgi:signal transduction histidine kinase